MMKPLLRLSATLLLFPALVLGQRVVVFDQDPDGAVPLDEATEARSLHEEAHTADAYFQGLVENSKRPGTNSKMMTADEDFARPDDLAEERPCLAKGTDRPMVLALLPATQQESYCMNLRGRASDSFYDPELWDFPDAYVSSDYKVCDCMSRTLTGGFVRTQMSQEDEDEAVFKNLSASIKEKQDRIQGLNDGMVVQSILISRTKEGGKALMNLYAAPVDEDTQSYLRSVRQEVIGKAIQKLKNPTPEKIKRIKAMADLIKAPTEVDKIQPPGALPAPGSCLSMRAYLAFEQIPKEVEFYHDLKKMGTFARDEDWSIDKLRLQYDEAYRDYDAETKDKKKRATLEVRVRALRARILFLKKNPLVSKVFSARPKDQKEAGIMSQHKDRLLQILKGGFGSGGSKSAFYAYQSDLRKFLNNPEIQAMARGRLDAEIRNEYGDRDKLMNPLVPTTQLALESKYELTTGESVKDCTVASRADAGECARKLMGYCSFVNQSFAEKEKGPTGALQTPSENLDQEARSDFDLDPDKNAGFKRFTREICQTVRISKKDPSKGMTFTEYRQMRCGGKSALRAECALEKSDLLVKQFILDYDPVPVAGHDLEQVGAIERVFASVMADQPKVSYTSKDLEEVKGHSTSYSAIVKSGGIQRSLGGPSPLEMPRSSQKDLPSKGQLPVRAAQLNTPAMADDPFLPPFMPGVAKTVAPVAPEAAVPGSNPTASERKALSEELLSSRRELDEAKKQRDREYVSEIEQRIKKLEEMLAQKGRDLERAKEERERKEDPASEARGRSTAEVPDADRSVSGASPLMKGSAAKAVNGADFNGRLSASMPEAVSTGTKGAASLSKASSLSSGAKASAGGGQLMNEALLSKYGIIVERTNNSVALAEAKYESGLTKLSESQEGQQIPLKVTAAEYERFKSNDLESLKEMYESQVRSKTGAVVKLSVTADGIKGSLQFYAIRDGDKVVFQPVRKARLSDLKSGLGRI